VTVSDDVAVVATLKEPDQSPEGFVGAVIVCACFVKVAVALMSEAADQSVFPACDNVTTQVPVDVALTAPFDATAQPVAVEPVPMA
jgi:hypothetical protein